MISIGAVYGGPEHMGSKIKNYISKVMCEFSDIHILPKYKNKPSINVVFFLYGSITEPDWDGVRDGKFSRKEKCLMLQAALPKEAVSCDDPIPFLEDALHGANAIAFHYFDEEAGMDYDLREAERLVSEVIEKVKNQK